MITVNHLKHIFKQERLTSVINYLTLMLCTRTNQTNNQLINKIHILVNGISSY